MQRVLQLLRNAFPATAAGSPPSTSLLRPGFSLIRAAWPACNHNLHHAAITVALPALPAAPRPRPSEWRGVSGAVVQVDLLAVSAQLGVCGPICAGTADPALQYQLSRRFFATLFPCLLLMWSRKLSSESPTNLVPSPGQNLHRNNFRASGLEGILISSCRLT